MQTSVLVLMMLLYHARLSVATNGSTCVSNRGLPYGANDCKEIGGPRVCIWNGTECFCANHGKYAKRSRSCQAPSGPTPSPPKPAPAPTPEPAPTLRPKPANAKSLSMLQKIFTWLAHHVLVDIVGGVGSIAVCGGGIYTAVAYAPRHQRALANGQARGMPMLEYLHVHPPDIEGVAGHS